MRLQGAEEKMKDFNRTKECSKKVERLLEADWNEWRKVLGEMFH